MPRSLDEIHQQGLEALREKLGRAGMIRFLQLYHKGHGDYAKERHNWLAKTSMEDLRTLASPKRKAKKGRKRS